MGKRRGRPRQAGRKRRASGRLRERAAAPDPGNPRAQALRAAFAMFQGGKAGNELGDAIGKAWAAGLLDGHKADGQAMRDAGRDYGRLWRLRYAALGIRTSCHERQAGRAAAPIDWPGMRGGDGGRLARMDAIVAAHPRTARDAFFALAVDYQDSDNVPPFLARLIEEARRLKGARADGIGPLRGDRERMARAGAILADLVRGGGRGRR